MLASLVKNYIIIIASYQKQSLILFAELARPYAPYREPVVLEAVAGT